MTAFDTLITDTRADIIERAEYDRDILSGKSEDGVRDWFSDVVHEVVDSAIPVYNADRAALVTDPRVWSSDISDYGPGTDLMHTIALHIYAALEEALYEDDSLFEELQTIADGEDV